MTSKSTDYGIKHGYRSGLEQQIANDLNELGVPAEYEKVAIPFLQPQKARKYTPDFVIRGKDKVLIIETKGRFMLADRQKHLLIKMQHPELDIRFVFTNSKSKISKVSNTTYAKWCTQHGFKFADKAVPKEWLEEVGAL